MKVGDLVQLSSYGSSRDYNFVVKISSQNPVGVVFAIKEGYNYPYRVHWFGVSNRKSIPMHTRRELKYAKLDKSAAK